MRPVHLAWRAAGITILSLLILFPLITLPSSAGAFVTSNPDFPVEIKYLYSFDAKLSGTQLGWVDQIVIDDTHDEVYLLDRSRQRLVVTETSGVFLFEIRYNNSGVKDPRYFDIDPESGDIYISELSRIVVLNYRGKYKGVVPFTGIPDIDKGFNIQSFALASTDNGLVIYIGDTVSQRLVVIKATGEFVRQYSFQKGGLGGNVKTIKLYNEGFLFLDSDIYAVRHFNYEGEEGESFGRLSSLLGGFSMPVGLAMDRVRERILVVDANRMMVVVFDLSGTAVYEFGGPRVFRWPRAVAVDRRGHVYVADNTGQIRVFEVTEVVMEEEEGVELAEIFEEVAPEAAEVFEEPAPVVIEPPVIELAPVVIPELELESVPAMLPEPVEIEEPAVIEIEEPAEVAKLVEPTDDVSRSVRDLEKLLPVFFEVASFKINEGFRVVLDRNVEWLARNPDADLLVRGFADPRGSAEYNMGLSKKRARAVMDYFILKGIDPARMKIVPLGIEKGKDMAEKTLASARRVEFWVVR